MTSILTAVMLQSRDYKEHDRLYELYTRERGRVTVMGKGTRKFSSKLAAHMTPYTELTCMVAHGRLWLKLAGVERRRDFAALRERPQGLAMAAAVNELVMGVGRGEADEHLFHFVLDTYAWLASLDELDTLRRAFVSSALTLKWLVMTGVGPHCDACVACGAEPGARERIFLSTLHGGLVCRLCVERDRARFADARSVSHEMVAALRFIAMAPFPDVLASSFVPLAPALTSLHQEFASYHLEREFKVPYFIRAFV